MQKWIKDYLAAEPPRSKSLIVTVFGDSIAPHGGKIWLGSLIKLLEPFGVTPRLVRTSVFRLVRENWLVAERHGRRSRYAFTPSGRKQFERAHEKIYFHSESAWNGEWTLVLGVRPALGHELQWEGFRRISPGVFAHPSADGEVLKEILGHVGSEAHTTICSARESSGVFCGTLKSLIPRCWDLKSVADSYCRFIGQFQPLASDAHHTTSLDSFLIRTLVMHAFRRVLLHDPLLPKALLPAAWPGSEAWELCRAIYRLNWQSAESYLMQELSSDEIPKAAPYFYARFGGL